MRSPLLISLLLLTTTALAEAQRPRIAVHPLVLEGVDSKKDREDLTALLPGIVISVGKVEIASPSDVDAELKKKGQAFCTAENLFKCLSYIADHTSAAHAMRIELRRGARLGEWELLANVVRVDGVVERQSDLFKFTQPDAVKLVPFARAKLEEFVATLNLSALPLAPPAQGSVEPVPAPIAGVVPHPEPVAVPVVVQPAPPAPTTPLMRKASYGLGAVALISLGVAVGLAASTKNDVDTLSMPGRLLKDGVVSGDDFPIAQRIEDKNKALVGCTIVGAIAATAAVTLFLLSDSETKTALVPAAFPGGGGLVLSSRF